MSGSATPPPALRGKAASKVGGRRRKISAKKSKPDTTAEKANTSSASRLDSTSLSRSVYETSPNVGNQTAQVTNNTPSISFLRFADGKAVLHGGDGGPRTVYVFQSMPANDQPSTVADKQHDPSLSASSFAGSTAVEPQLSTPEKTPGGRAVSVISGSSTTISDDAEQPKPNVNKSDSPVVPAAEKSKSSKPPKSSKSPQGSPTLVSGTTNSPSGEKAKNVREDGKAKAPKKKNAIPKAPKAVVSQPVDDILVMIRQERQYLNQGPRFNIWIGDVEVKEMAKRFAMAASPVLNQYFTEHPESSEYRVKAGYMDARAVHTLLKWWPQHYANVFEAEPLHVTKYLEDIPIIRAATLLGMDKYCDGVKIYWREWLKNHIPDYDFIACAEANRLSEKGFLWTGVVNNLCSLRYKGGIPDKDVFDAFLALHPDLANAMEHTDKYHKERLESERFARWQQNQREKKVRLEQEDAAKVIMNKNGVKTVSGEQARMLRGF